MGLWLAGLTLGGLIMWIGVPLGWLWIGSQIEGATDSLGLAVAVMFAGAIATMAGAFRAMAAITGRYQAARVARGLEDTGNFPLEVVLVCSACAAGIALLVFLVVG